MLCVKEWQKQQVHLFAHEVKAVNNEVKDPDVILLSRQWPHGPNVISKEFSVGLSQRSSSNTLKYQSPLILKSTSITARA